MLGAAAGEDPGAAGAGNSLARGRAGRLAKSRDLVPAFGYRAVAERKKQRRATGGRLARLPEAGKEADGAKGGTFCEVLWNGRKTTVPPAIHAGTGKPYEWLDPAHTLFNTRVVELPAITIADIDALEAAIKPWHLRAVRREDEMIRELAAACNHNALTRDDGGKRGVLATIRSGLKKAINDPFRELKDRPQPPKNGRTRAKAPPQAANSGIGGESGAATGAHPQPGRGRSAMGSG